MNSNIEPCAHCGEDINLNVDIYAKDDDRYFCSYQCKTKYFTKEDKVRDNVTYKYCGNEFDINHIEDCDPSYCSFHCESNDKNKKEHIMAKPSNNVVENIQQIVNDKPGITSRELLDTYKNDWRDFNHDTDPFDPLVDLDYMCNNELLQKIKYTYTIDDREYEVIAYFPASTEFNIW